jgi:hypothetical protein
MTIECSTLLKDFMHTNNVDFQLVPPGIHRRNAAERAIRTFKNHFVTGLCSVDKNFPIHLWDRLLPQAEITLNLLRGSRINPKLSAWAQVHGTFDFNRTPLGPPGCRVLAHEKPDKHKTWAPHGLDSWYVGPALESYRCYNIWIWETRAIRIINTLTWFPTKVKLPDSSSTDVILNCLQDILHALKNPAPKSPLAPHTGTQTQALHGLVSTRLPTSPAPCTGSTTANGRLHASHRSCTSEGAICPSRTRFGEYPTTEGGDPRYGPQSHPTQRLSPRWPHD